MAVDESACSALLPLHAGDHERFPCLTLSFRPSTRTQKPTFVSELLAFFQILKTNRTFTRHQKPTFGSELLASFKILKRAFARRALLSLSGGGSQNQSNGSN
jgi:hypothetical protein